jgi:3-methyladenine DNA glycosylase AlkD
MEIFLAFVKDFGVKESISLFRSDCFASRITEQSYMEIFLAFVKDFGVKDAISLFRSGCFASRITEQSYMEIFLAFVKDFGVKDAISLFRSGCFASRITEQSYMEIFLAFVKDFGVKDAISLFRSNTIACRLNNENFISRLMYCIQALKDSNCRGIITQFKVIAPYYELLSENFYESLIKSESGWSESLCKKFVKNINVGDNKLVDDRVWKKVLDDRSEYQKLLTRQLCAKQLLPPPPTTCPYCFTKFGEHMGATLRIMHIDGKLCKDIKQR